jgi:hypothetical protein
VGGGAALLVAGGTYGVVARSSFDDSTGLSTAFGALSIMKAGRLARLDAQGRPATESLATAASQITGLGAVASVSSASRRGSSNPNVSLAVHTHDSGVIPDSGWPQPENFTWGDVVLLEVALRNNRSEPVLFAPGQLRLKLVPSGITVTPQDFNRGPGAIGADATEYLWISYLAPHDSLDMELEYSEPEQDGTMSLALPPLTVSQVKS